MIRTIIAWLRGPIVASTEADYEALRDYLAEARTYIQVDDNPTISGDTAWGYEIGRPAYVKPHAHTYAGRVRMLGAHCMRCRK